MLCNDCKEKATCKKTCKAVEEWLQEQKIFSAGWIRHKVISKNRKFYREVGVDNIDKVAEQRALELKYGRRKEKPSSD
jgi:hypothetical protein